MTQFKSRDSALRALKRYKPRPRLDFQEPKMHGYTEAELWLVRVLFELEEFKVENPEAWPTEKIQRPYKLLRSIGRGVRLYPIPDWGANYAKVMTRMEGLSAIAVWKEMSSVISNAIYHARIKELRKQNGVSARTYVTDEAADLEADWWLTSPVDATSGDKIIIKP